MSDYIIRGMAADKQVRFFAANTKDLVEKARRIHNTSPIATAALGRLMTGTAMMGSMCKNDSDVITLQIQCSGPIGGLTVTADSKANVKGYVNNPDVMLPPSKEGKLDVGKALDLGVLTVIKDIGLKEPYSGQTHLVSGEIAEDLTYYFAASEQIPTSVALGVLMNKDNTVRQAGGFIIQMMPYAEEETISKLEKKIAEFKSVTYALEHEHTPEKMMEDLLGDMDMKIYEKVPTQFHCNCSKERVEKAVISVGKKEIQISGLFVDDNLNQLGQKASQSVLDMIRWTNYLIDCTFQYEESVQKNYSLNEKVDQYIREHYRENIGRTEIAEQFYLAPEYLSKTYKKLTGRTIKDTITEYRIDEAKRMLERGERVSDVAETVGFDNFTYFSTIFKKYTGVSPNQYCKK